MEGGIHYLAIQKPSSRGLKRNYINTSASQAERINKKHSQNMSPIAPEFSAKKTKKVAKISLILIQTKSYKKFAVTTFSLTVFIHYLI